MQAGKLNLRVAFYRLPPATLIPVLLMTTWASLRGRPEGAAPPQTSLRHPLLFEVRLRSRTDVVAGDYAQWAGRLFYVYGVRDPDGRGAELIASAQELAGAVATYTPAGGGAAVATRALIQRDSPYIAAFSQRVDYRSRIELPIFETGRAAPGATVAVGGVTYTLLGLVDGGDDGVIRQYWSTP